MPFVQAVGLQIESADDGVAVVSIPLSEVVTYDGAAFAAIAIGLVADVAAGAATLRTLPVDEMALTAAVDSTMTASTKGDRLSARAQLRERDETRLIFDAIVEVSSLRGEPRECGRGVVTMRVARPN
jgi:acyl-coenzyme A thioesterase PaaI-like protein